jgi:hypothetical protein
LANQILCITDTEDQVARFDLTVFKWSVIQLLLANKPRGIRRRDDRQVRNGIF